MLTVPLVGNTIDLPTDRLGHAWRIPNMPTLQDFDVRSRGVAMLVEDWEARQAAVRQTWKVDDLASLVVDAIAAAAEVRAASRNQAVPGQSLADRIGKLAYFLRLLDQLMNSANLIEDRVSVFESEGYAVDNADQLRQAISLLSEMISDVRSDLEEAEWQELDQQALSTQELLEIRDHLRASGQASA